VVNCKRVEKTGCLLHPDDAFTSVRADSSSGVWWNANHPNNPDIENPMGEYNCPGNINGHDHPNKQPVPLNSYAYNHPHSHSLYTHTNPDGMHAGWRKG